MQFSSCLPNMEFNDSSHKDILNVDIMVPMERRNNFDRGFLSLAWTVVKRVQRVLVLGREESSIPPLSQETEILYIEENHLPPFFCMENMSHKTTKKWTAGGQNNFLHGILYLLKCTLKICNPKRSLNGYQVVFHLMDNELRGDRK